MQWISLALNGCSIPVRVLFKKNKRTAVIYSMSFTNNSRIIRWLFQHVTGSLWILCFYQNFESNTKEQEVTLESEREQLVGCLGLDATICSTESGVVQNVPCYRTYNTRPTYKPVNLRKQPMATHDDCMTKNLTTSVLSRQTNTAAGVTDWNISRA